MNSAKHESTSFSPYFIVFGKEMILNGKEHDLRNTNVLLNQDHDVQDELDRNEVFEKVKENITKAYNRYSHYYNLRSRTKNIKVGDIVFKTNHVLSKKADKFAAKLASKKNK
jgi:hypothetical protein